MKVSQWQVVTGRFHYDFGVYFNNKYVVNGGPDWYFEEDLDYYVCIKKIDDETVEILSYVARDNE